MDAEQLKAELSKLDELRKTLVKQISVAEGKTISRVEWEQMSAKESSDFFAAGGKVVD